MHLFKTLASNQSSQDNTPHVSHQKTKGLQLLISLASEFRLASSRFICIVANLASRDDRLCPAGVQKE